VIRTSATSTTATGGSIKGVERANNGASKGALTGFDNYSDSDSD
jgi:hypothetical protein